MNKAKMLVYFGVALVLLVGATLSGCPKPTTTGTTGGVTPTITATTVQKPIILRYGSPSPPSGLTWDGEEAAAQYITGNSGGRIVVEHYAVGVLCTANDLLSAVSQGALDIGGGGPAYFAGLFHKLTLFEVPGFCSDYVVTCKVMASEPLYSKYLLPEWTKHNVTVFGVQGLSSTSIWSKRKIESFNDLKGLKISGASDSTVRALGKLGCAGIRMAGGDTYLALQTGVLDGATQTPDNAKKSRYEEVIKYMVAGFGFSAQISGAYINTPRYNSLPPDLQNVVREALVGYLKYKFDNDGAVSKVALDYMKGKGLQVLTMPQADLNLMNAKLSSMLDEWIATEEAAGFTDTRQFFKEATELRDQYLAGSVK